MHVLRFHHLVASDRHCIHPTVLRPRLARSMAKMDCKNNILHAHVGFHTWFLISFFSFKLVQTCSNILILPQSNHSICQWNHLAFATKHSDLHRKNTKWPVIYQEKIRWTQIASSRLAMPGRIGNSSGDRSGKPNIPQQVVFHTPKCGPYNPIDPKQPNPPKKHQKDWLSDTIRLSFDAFWLKSSKMWSKNRSFYP